MTVALAIGLSVVQRSLTDVSTASKLEQSSRAFSAAEAGIEQVLGGGGLEVDFRSDNQANASVVVRSSLPRQVLATEQQDALEYPPLTRDEVAHFWLADPSNLSIAYDQPKLEVYWGKTPPPTNDIEKPAVEIKIIYENGGGEYESKSYFIDPVAATRGNGFSLPGDLVFDSGSVCGSVPLIKSIQGSNRSFYCKVILKDLNLLPRLILARIRLLYTTSQEPIAIRAVTGCSTNCLPPQASIYESIGKAGETQRTVQLFKEDKVVPFYFDYAIFSAGEIKKLSN